MSYSAPFPGKEWVATYYLQNKLVDVSSSLIGKVPLAEAASVFEDLKSRGKLKAKDFGGLGMNKEFLFSH